MVFRVSGPRPTIIDWAVLGQICGSDEALLQRFLEAFLADGRKDATDLARALESGNLTEISRVAHRIYGAALTAGAAELARVSLSLDVASLAGETLHVAELGPRVRDQFAVVTELIVSRRRPEVR